MIGGSRRALLALAMLSLATLACNLLPGLPATPTLAPTEPPSLTPVAFEATGTPTATATPTMSPSVTLSASPTLTPTFTLTPSVTASETFTPSQTPSQTPSGTASSTATFAPSATPTFTPSSTNTPTFAPTQTPTLPPSLTPTLTPTLSPTLLILVFATPTPTPETRIITATPFPTLITVALATPTPTLAPTLATPVTPLPPIVTVVTRQPIPDVDLPTRAPSVPILTNTPGTPIPGLGPTPTGVDVASQPTPLVLGDGLVSVEGGALVIPQAGTEGQIKSYTISRYGRQAIVSSDGRMTIDGSLYYGDNGKHIRQEFVMARWSPDGNWLAYIVQTPNAEGGSLSFTQTIDDGVWVLEIYRAGAKPNHVLRNNYVSGSNEFPYRVARDMTWGPDSDALLVTITGPGGITGTILTGKSRSANETAPGLFQIRQQAGGTWLPDSSGWVTTTSTPGLPVQMGIYNRNSGQFQAVLDGALNGLWIQNPARLSDGRFAFLGKPSPNGLLTDGPTNLRLYILTPGGTFQSPSIQMVSSVLPGAVVRAEWNPAGTAILIHLQMSDGALRSAVMNLNGELTLLRTGSTSINWQR